MSNLKSIAGKNGCGNSRSIATGKAGCQISFGTPTHAIRLRKGTIIPSTTIFNLAFLVSLVQQGIATPVMDATAFERLSGEDGVSTTADTTERLNVLGLPKYKLTFQEGHEFYRQMAKLTGFKNSDWLIIDDSGNMKIAINSKGDFVGFTAGQVIAEQVMEKVQGGDGESKSMTIQFINRNQWDSNYTILTQQQSQIEWEEVAGANPVEILFKSVPSALDTTIVISTLLASDKDSHVEGALVTDFKVTVDGVDAIVSGIVEDVANKQYTLTVPALVAATSIEVSYFDSLTQLVNINIDDIIFSSIPATEIVQV